MDNKKEIIIPQGWEIDEVRGNKIILTENTNKKWYIARDINGDLYLYLGKPIKNINEECWYAQLGKAICFENDEFPNVKWEDEEPTEVELIIKKKV